MLYEYIKRIADEAKESERRILEVQEAQDGSHGRPHSAFFVGGRYHGLYMTHEELKRAGNGKYTIRWSAIEGINHALDNLDLEDQPLVDGYLSPMWDGGRLRYETQEVYDRLFD